MFRKKSLVNVSLNKVHSNMGFDAHGKWMRNELVRKAFWIGESVNKYRSNKTF